ncbi:MAG: electron transport complex subunit RsxC [Gammaproteobacteria bacterium]|nr:electron transport complex subunit RsxC [Gammaproteobacteria bacterium]
MNLNPAPAPSGRRLWRFHGGIHPPGEKALSTAGPIAPVWLPALLVLPLQQHIGNPAQPLVAVGDRVLKGQEIARADGVVSAGLHAPSSGWVRQIGDHPIAHASGLSTPCIFIETDGEERWAELPEPMTDFAQRDPGEVLARIRWAGIVGLGGAAFPSAFKLSPGPDRPIHTLIINAAECEPYISCDDMLMRRDAAKLLDGIRILRHVLDVTGECLIGIEDNKPEAIAALKAALAADPLPSTELVIIPTVYPSGGEKQLIRVLTGQELASKSLPAQIGIVCHNVGTTVAVADAVLRGIPLISRVLTLTGRGLAQPGNQEVLIGTLAADLIAARGGYRPGVQRLILGGPMMGPALPSDQVPLTKASNCLLVPGPGELEDPGAAGPCIRCGQCAEVCPVQLLPQQLYWYARSREMDKVQDYNLFDCIECGCCVQVCPSHIPLVQYYRFAKTSIWNQAEEKRKAEHARQRHEARQARLERVERERKEKLKQKNEALRQKSAGAKGDGDGDAAPADPKQAAIAAALARAKAKKAALAEQGVAPKNTEQLTPAQQKQVDAAQQRRTKAAVKPAPDTDPDAAPDAVKQEDVE